MTKLGNMRPRVAIVNDTAGNGHFGCQAVMNTIAEQMEKAGLDIVVSWPVDYDWRPRKSWFSRQRLDAIVVNGEGSIHHTDTRAKAAYLCEIARFARHDLKIPIVLINATMTDIGETARKDLECFDAIYVRESMTYKYLMDLGLESRVVPDLSVFCSRAQEGKSGQALSVLVTDSVIEDVSEKLKGFARSRDIDFIEMEITRKSSLPLRVFHKMQKRLANPERLSRPDTAGSDDGLNKFFTRISGAEALLTGRFHSVMLCIAARTPFLALESNTPKIRSVAIDVFGTAERVISLEALDDSTFRHTWCGAAQFTESEIKAIDDYLSDGRNKMEEMFSDIAERAHGAKAP